MKLMTLNIWGGHVRDPLLKFIEVQQEVDFFCLQEVYNQAQAKISNDNREVCLNIFSELHALLPNHEPFFRPLVNGVYGIGMFVKKDVKIVEEGELTIFENPNYSGCGPTHSRNLQWIKCHINNTSHYIMNVHGLWNGRGKSDSPERICQSQKIRQFVEEVEGPTILCGDFNLRPDTESIRILKKDMKDLIQMYGVDSTRTRFYEKEEKFADYIFTSPEIKINHFQILKDEVSDHCPLLIDFVLASG